MRAADFTIRILAPCPHKAGTQTWRAAMIATGMEGCAIEEIVSALTAFERTREKGVQDPARWLTHFAGLESKASSKAIAPWIEVTFNGQKAASTSAFREILASRARADA